VQAAPVAEISDDIGAFAATLRARLRGGPLCVILAEDSVLIAETVAHHRRLGFGRIAIVAPAHVRIGALVGADVDVLRQDIRRGKAAAMLDMLAAALPGTWIWYCYNAEFLFFPFCETRRIADLVAFHAEERRESMLSTVIDLYAPDLRTDPDGVSMEDAHLDALGYTASPRLDRNAGWAPRERQFDIFGGLRRRFAEHVPWHRRSITRLGLFRARAGVRIEEDLSFSDAVMNTHTCAWHRNVTATTLSFRAAKALRANPESRAAVTGFVWRGSVRFDWHSRQLMELGLMEPGQWF
jgi:hypothetical protein